MENFGMSMLWFWVCYFIVTIVGILHTVFNIYVLHYLDQVILQSLTKNTNNAYFVGKTGSITIFFTVLIAVFILVFARNTFFNNSKEGM